MLPSLVLVALYLAIFVLLIRSWRSFWDRRVTRADWALGTALGLFAPLPISVVVHELGHAVVAWISSGTRPGIHLDLFGGAVSTGGYDSAAQRWAVFVAGTVAVAATAVGSLALGASAKAAQPAVRQLLIIGGLGLVVGHLVLLPLLSIGRWSDWSVIYDSSSTLSLSWAAGVAHALLLVLVWHWWRSRLRWTLRAIQQGQEGQLLTLEALHDRDPGDLEARLRLADLCASIGDLVRSHRLLADAPADVAAVSLARSRLAVRRRRWQDTMAATEAGLRAPDVDEEARQRLTADRAIALAKLGRHSEAVRVFGELEPPLADDWWLRYLRGQARISAGDTAGGHADLRSVTDDLPRRTLLHAHIDAVLQGRRSAWRALVLNVVWRLAPAPVPDGIKGGGSSADLSR